MKIVIWIPGFLLALLLLVIGTERIASERIEVVELHTIGEMGKPAVTRLWVVDDEGYQYIRAASENSEWFSRLRQNPEVLLTRNNSTMTYRAVLRPDKTDRINQLMRDKYTWGDNYIGLLIGGRGGSIPVELHPIR